MPDDLKEFIHERYRRTDEKLDRLLNEMVDIKARVGRMEISLSHVQVTLAEHSNRMDRIEGRLDRIEKRLDLAEAES